MSVEEVEIILREYNKDYKAEREWSRFCLFTEALMHGAKLKKPEDLLTFPWEASTKKKDKPSRESMNEAVERMSKSLQLAKL